MELPHPNGPLITGTMVDASQSQDLGATAGVGLGEDGEAQVSGPRPEGGAVACSRAGLWREVVRVGRSTVLAAWASSVSTPYSHRVRLSTRVGPVARTR